MHDLVEMDGGGQISEAIIRSSADKGIDNFRFRKMNVGYRIGADGVIPGGVEVEYIEYILRLIFAADILILKLMQMVQWMFALELIEMNFCPLPKMMLKLLI